MKLSANNMQAMPGFVGSTESGKRVFSAFGMILDRMREKLWASAKNRFTESQSPALMSEFGLPKHPVFLARKWAHSADRCTKLGLKNMMVEFGLPNFSIYTPNGVSMVNGIVPYGAPAFINKFSTPYSTHWTLVVWDVPLPKFGTLLPAMFPSLLITQGMPDTPLTVGRDIGFWRYTLGGLGGEPSTPPDHDIVKQICEYHSPVGEPCLEVIYCYHNNTTGVSSLLTVDGLPALDSDIISSRYVQGYRTDYT